MTASTSTPDGKRHVFSPWLDVITTFDRLPDATAQKTVLEREGFEVRLQDERRLQRYWFWATNEGSALRTQVKAQSRCHFQRSSPNARPIQKLIMKIRKKEKQPGSKRSSPRQEENGNSSALRLRHILVPLDFSGKSRQALEFAVPLAERYGGRIIVVHVVQPPAVLSAIPGGGQYLVPMDSDTVFNASKGRLEDLAVKLVPPRLLARTLVRQGIPYDEITSAARTLKVDLIVIATHGYSGLKRALIGSTAERVVRHAHCPVLVVRRR